MSKRKDGPRPAVIGTCSLSARDISDSDQTLANGLAMVDEMARKADENGWSLDMVVLPEGFAHVDGSSSLENAETLDGRTVTALAEKARKYSTYAAVSLWLREGEETYNSVVMLDREGKSIGVYHKTFPVVLPDGSLEGGVTSGHEFPVFDLDFGRVGVQICFDVCYDEGWEALAAQEAELVLFPSAAPGVSALISHAYRHAYYIVASTYRPPAIIVNPLGHEIAKAANDREVVVVRIDLDYRILPSRFIWTRGNEVKKKYGDSVDFGWHDAEGFCLLTSSDPKLPIGRLVEMENLETISDFLSRNQQAQTAARGRSLSMPEHGR
ncbi:carbon-nitrogen hydrolase family protein [Candidatus Poribacteria bacterium]